ncbi:MAG TPA: hypothetical protein VHG91_14615, partial [Longimicrobium sp.]|nr:hypothetical protein [Longimicrobium sp.]
RASGELWRAANGGRTLGVECARTDGQHAGLTLSFRCGGGPPGEGFRGSFSANVMWRREPGGGRRERTVFEARTREVKYTGPPPLDELLALLPPLEEAMRRALARGGPPGATAKVYIVESEADWGRRVDEEIEFTSREEAERYADEYNASFNRGPVRSEWSMVAKVERADGRSVLG